MQVVRGIVVIATLMLAISCSGGVEPAENAETSATTAVPRDVMIPTNGWIQVGVEIFDLAFTCYAAGAGDVVAIGVGVDSESGERVEALVQGFLGQPYLGVTVGSSTRYEASLEDPLEVYVHDDTISAGAVRWKRDLDLESGGGEVVGFGAVFVECPSYEGRLPEGY